MVRILHTSDIHLEKILTKTSYSSKFSEERRSDLWETIERLLEYAKDNKVDLVLIAGDLYENEYFGLNHVYKLFEIFKRYSPLEIVLLAGNHDRHLKDSVFNKLDIPNNLNLISSDSLDYVYYPTLNTRVYGIGWENDTYYNFQIDHFSLNCEFINILMLHADLINKDHKYMYLEKEMISCLGFDYVALGHIHSYIELDTRIAYSGTPEPLDFGEEGAKGFLIVDIHGDQISKQFIPFAKRTFESVKIKFNEYTTEEDVIKALKKLKNKDNFYRIYLEGIISSELEYKLDYLIESTTYDFYYKEVINRLLIEMPNQEILQNPFTDAFIEYIKKSKLDQNSQIKAINKGIKLIMGDYYVDN